jgi:hypothetical protein
MILSLTPLCAMPIVVWFMIGFGVYKLIKWAVGKVVEYGRK